MEWKPFWIFLCAFSLAVVVLYLMNRHRSVRYRQLWCPISAFACCCGVLWAFIKARAALEALIPPVVDFLTLHAGFPPVSPSWTFALYFNLMFLLAFVLLKAVVHLIAAVAAALVRFARWLRNRFGGPSEAGIPVGLAPAYAWYPDRGVTLKGSWIFTAILHRRAAAFAFVVLAAMLGAAFSGLPDFYRPLVPTFPALPLLLLLEIAWYLGGPRPSPRAGTVKGEDEKPEDVGKCHGLWEDYLKQWPDRVLASFPDCVIHSDSTEGEPGQALDPEVSFLIESLRRRGVKLGAKQAEILNQLWEGRDVLVSSHSYHYVSPMLFCAVQKTILDGKKVLFLTGKSACSGDCAHWVRWIEDNLRRRLYASLTCTVANLDSFTGKEDILIGSIDELLAFLIGSADELQAFDLATRSGWFSRLGMAVTLNMPEATYPNPLASAVLFDLLKGWRDPLQIVLLTTDHRVNMEATAQDHLSANPVEHYLHQGPGEACLLAWRLEGEQPFHAGLLNCERYFPGEPILAWFAAQRGVRPVYLTGIEEEPWDTDFQELEQHAALPGGSGTIRDVFRRLPASCTLDPEPRPLVVVRDGASNPAIAARQAFALGTESVLAHVVSPAPMLRDYIADNMEFFLESPVSALTPMLRWSSRSTAAHYLVERLLRWRLTEDDLSRYLNRRRREAAELEEITFREWLARLLVLHFGEHAGSLGEWIRLEETWTYSERRDLVTRQTIGDFTRKAIFDLSPQGRTAVRRYAETYIHICDPGGDTLEIIPRGLVHQKYLPGQIHSFQGKPYRIGNEEPHRNVLKTDLSPRSACSVYRNEARVSLKSALPLSGKPYKQVGGCEVMTAHLDADFEVQTPGYYEFKRGIDLTIQERSRQPLHPSQVPVRSYRSGRIWAFSVRNDSTAGEGNRVVKDPAALSFTLALLLNELFPTVFPESHHYIRALTPHPFPPGCGEAFRLVPSFVVADGTRPAAARDEVLVYLIEDSPYDMGLLEAFAHNWQYVIQVLEDYLYWTLNQADSEKPFLAFGGGSISADLALGELLVILEALLHGTDHRIRKRRELFKPPRSREDNPGATAEHRCDFCGAILSDNAYERLEDGRERCTDCRKAAVDDIERLKLIYQEARSCIEKEFGISIRQDIDVTFAGAAEIQEVRGVEFVPTRGFDPRAVGVARQQNGKCTVYIEKGQPYPMIFACIVHELTHTWQFDHLDMQRMAADSDKLLAEGHAVWAEIHCLLSRGMGASYCEAEKKREDEYGRGYWLIEKKLEEHRSQDAFRLLLDLYPRTTTS